MSERISGKTKLIGLLATPISHSISPKMHNEAFSKLGLDYAYIAFDCGSENLEEVVKGFKALNIRGYNVSMPNKISICKYMDKLDSSAELIGAVNTVVNNNGILTGYNTDGIGYMKSLKDEGINIIGKKMTLIGAGGAAKAIAIQAALDGVKEISIFNIKDKFFEVGEKTVKDINEKTKCKARIFDLADQKQLAIEISESTILTDASPVGMKPLEELCNIKDPLMLRKDLIVSDVVYIPNKTKLLEIAETRGCKIINGVGMILGQGAAAFKLWTGEEMPIDYIREKLKLDKLN